MYFKNDQKIDHKQTRQPRQQQQFSNQPNVPLSVEDLEYYGGFCDPLLSVSFMRKQIRVRLTFDLKHHTTFQTLQKFFNGQLLPGKTNVCTWQLIHGHALAFLNLMRFHSQQKQPLAQLCYDYVVFALEHRYVRKEKLDMWKDIIYSQSTLPVQVHYLSSYYTAGLFDSVGHIQWNNNPSNCVYTFRNIHLCYNVFQYLTQMYGQECQINESENTLTFQHNTRLFHNPYGPILCKGQHKQTMLHVTKHTSLSV